MPIRIEKHARAAREPEDGFRLLVTRYWIRRMPEQGVDDWCRDLAPSAELLRRSKAEEDLFSSVDSTGDWIAEYRDEMSQMRHLISALAQRHLRGEVISLLCACHDPTKCHRSILAELILEIAEDITFERDANER